MSECPCGSGLAYGECCEPVISGERSAASAEQLMRSRYSAYVKVDTDYIYATTHLKHREGYDQAGTKEWAEKADWQGLTVVATKNGGPEDSAGEVEFIARYKEKGLLKEHHELAQFIKDEDRWFFTDGNAVTHKPIVRSGPKIGRNDPCGCGSGHKYKKCCGK